MTYDVRKLHNQLYHEGRSAERAAVLAEWLEESPVEV